MSGNDDQVWVEALAGRAVAAGGGAAARDGLSLRARILARPVAEAPPVPATDAAREDDLIEQARREGLLPGARHAWWSGWRGALTLAAAASVVAVIGFIARPAREPEVVRGTPGAIARLEAADPEALRRVIVDELAAAGVRATTYERLGRFGIDADLPAPITPAIAEVLRRHAIAVPPDGALEVEIAPPATP